MAQFKINTAFNSQPLWQQLSIVLAFNTFVAMLIHLIAPNSVFVNQLTLSQSIGLSIFLSFILFSHFIELKRWKMLLPLITGSLMGVTIAITINAMLLNASFEQIADAIQIKYTNILSTLFLALLFGGIILVFFVSREKILLANTKLQAEQLRNLDYNKQLVETNLRLLQAQIEPHFLFNTLSNVISLIENDPEKSKMLLESLTLFLRASLKRSSEQQQLLRNEIILIKNYLDIFKIRMSDRLTYKINIQNGTLDCKFPPLLLQPVIENAIIHGLEPLTEGGEINITIARIDNMLIITVVDTGKGLQSEVIKGFGLANIRERIKSVYAQEGCLRIEEHKPKGVAVTIQVPYEEI